MGSGCRHLREPVIRKSQLPRERTPAGPAPYVQLAVEQHVQLSEEQMSPARGPTWAKLLGMLEALVAWP